jgi:hypothetical protein
VFCAVLWEKEQVLLKFYFVMEVDCMRKMLRVFVFAALISLCAGEAVFSQGLTFSGAITGGIGGWFGDGAPKLLSMDNYSGEAGVSLTGSMDNDDKTAGVSANLSVWPKGYTDGKLYPFLLYAYGYAKLWDELVTLKGGLINDTTFNTPGECLRTDAGEGVGALLILKPHSMLQLGLGAYVGLLQLPNHQVDPYVSSNPSYDNGFVDADGGVYTASMAFSLPNVLSLAAAYRLPYKYNGDNPDRLTAGIKVTAISDITLAVEAQLTGISDNEIVTRYTFTPVYTRDALKVGLNSVVRTNNGPKFIPTWGDDPYAGFMAYGAYTLGKWVPWADVYFGMGGTGPDDYWWKNFYLQGVTYNLDDKFIAFRPSVTYYATSLMSIELGGLINGRMPDGGDMEFDGSVYLSFVYIF